MTTLSPWMVPLGWIGKPLDIEVAPTLADGPVRVATAVAARVG